MPGWLIFVFILAAGAAVLWLGPKGWRTYIAGVVATLVPLIGQILNYLSGFGWNQVIDARAAMWTVGAIGVLMIIFNWVNKRLYGKTPKAGATPTAQPTPPKAGA
jgi:hypothetical protein